jgi:hypothetical protein
MTVSSRSRDNDIATRRWDLDYVGSTCEWRLLNGPASGSEERLASLQNLASGTIVLWENLDRIVDGSSPEDGKAHRRFLDLVELVETHLSMTFHRYLVGRKAISMSINGRAVAPWDPFLEDEDATQRLPEEKLRLHNRVVVVRSYVLPHHSKIDRTVHDRAAGQRGWNAQQGFYIYRNQRLLVAGDWLGLGFQKEEHYKLARIAIDLTNTMDHDWDIDVRKSRAHPPGALRDDLKRIARVTRERAASIYRHRGKVLSRTLGGERELLWERSVKHGSIAYRINPQHPVVLAALTTPPPYTGAVRALIRLIEETIPVPLIQVDAAEYTDAHAPPFSRVPDDVREVARVAYQALRAQGLAPADALRRLLITEPFDHFADVVASIAQQECPDVEAPA